MPTTLISVTWVDAEGDKITVPTYWDSTDVATVADAQAVITGLEGLLENVAGPVILSAEVKFPLTASQVENADSGYSVFSGATLSFRNSDGVGDQLYIPGILQSQIADQVVIPSTTEMAALIAALSTSTGVGANAARISSRGSGSLWNAYVKGKRSTRKP